MPVTEMSASAAMREVDPLLKDLNEKKQRFRQSIVSLQEQSYAEKTHARKVVENEIKSLEEELSRLSLEERTVQLQASTSATGMAGVNKDSEPQKILDEASPNNFQKINKLLPIKDQGIAKLRDEIRVKSAHWMLKTKVLKSQLEKHRRVDQELKKKVLKLEFSLQEARAQTRKLQRMGKRRDWALKELRDQLVAKQAPPSSVSNEKSNFWEIIGFKIVVPMSMLILTMFSK